MITNQTTIKTFKKVKFENSQSKRKEATLKTWARDNKQLRFIVKSDYLNK